MRIQLLLFILALLIADKVIGQSPEQLASFSFVSHPEQRYGFDPCHYKEWEKHHIQKKNESGNKFCVSNKAVGFLETDVVIFLFDRIPNPQKLSFEYGEGKKIPFQLDSDTSATLYLPRERNSYLVKAKLEDQVVSYLNIKVYKPIVQEVQIVLLNDSEVDEQLIQKYLDSVYLQCNFQLKILPPISYKDSILQSILLDNPSYQNDRYTRQMREFRDRFFEGDLYAKNKYYLFIIDGFVNKSRKGYMPKNKAFGFVKSQTSPRFELTIARQLGYGVGVLNNSWANNGPSRGSTLNLMDINGGTELTMDQWDDLHRYYKNFLFYDGDEDVITNNGMVAYYFWEEDAQGKIISADSVLLTAIKRPYKKNYRSYHLNIQDQLFEVVFQYKTILICWLHFILWGVLFLVFIIVRAVVKRRWKRDLTSYAKRKMIKWAVGSATILLSYFGYYFIGYQLDKYQVVSGHISEFDELGYYAVNRSVLQNEFLRDNPESTLSSEILIKKGDQWYIKQRKKVLYFDAKQGLDGKITELKFISDNDNLILKHHQYLRPASSHYIVINCISPDDSLTDQRVYNHLGIDLTSKLILSDATKRILVFVNGYRPTSNGHSFEENFGDIQKNGIEFPNSSNLIYNYDRFNYWRPWKAIDEQFIKRINPTETYYADGHFSVETSNHRSLYSFSSLSTSYPRRCNNRKKHICHTQKIKSLSLYGDKVVKTKDLLPSNSNQSGFDKRVNNGKIAGRNLLVMLNEIPNRSVNDTLFIVAHSMGYAYSLGIIEELRGKIAFGGYYIISPENASAGKVKLDEWGQVWQYGSDFITDPPCLQDGVAPQTCAGGLSENERVYIPENLYYRKGFFDSHFIGYYEWIFKIPEGQKGRILQH
jgi:hypothetical protein